MKDMIQAKCIKKFRNKNNRIYGYRLQDINGQMQDVYADRLKIAIKRKQIHVVNLTLTSDGRLIDSYERILQNYRILGKPINNKTNIEKASNDGIIRNKDNIPKRIGAKMNNNRLDRVNSVSNEYSIKLVFALAKHFSITIQDVLVIFDKIKYWDVINDADTCCLLAHDGIQSNIKDLEGAFYGVLSRN